MSACAHPLDDPDLFLLILKHTGIDMDLDVSNPSAERARLRLLHSTAAKLIDGLCQSYRDVRRSGDRLLTIDPADVAARAKAAMHKLGPIRRLQLEGLDDDALATVLAEAGRTAAQGRPLETLSMQRGHFSGRCLYTCDPRFDEALPGHSPLVGDDGGGDFYGGGLEVGSSLGSFAPALLPSPTLRLLPRLLELDLGGCGALTDAGLEALTGEAPLLARLHLTLNAQLRRPRLRLPWLRSATLAVCANLEDVAVEALCDGAPLLRELSLWRCSSLVAPPLRGTYLEGLNLCECTDLGDGALRALASGCPALASLQLAGCESLAGGTLHWGGGPCLTSLDVSDVRTCTDEMLTHACRASPGLTRLDFSRGGSAVVSPSVGGGKLTTLIATKCEQLADEAVNHACDHAPMLTSLALALCTSLHAPRIHGDHLAELNLSGCHRLQDESLTHACAHCPRLRSIALSLCAALVAPVIEGAHLRRIELAHAEHLSRPRLGGPALEELGLAGCASLQDAAVERACERSPRLRKLSISGCASLQRPRLASASLAVLDCHAVAQAVVAAATDRKACPALRKLACETCADDEYEEIN